jgi:2'-5' RNA ligase
MTLLRAFVAIELPSTIQDAVQKASAPLRQALGAGLVRWVPPQNMHLTLKFLGDVSPANLDLLAQILKVEASQHKPFEMEIGGLGSFPSPKRARVIWVGIQPPAALEALQRNVEAAAARMGYPPEERAFSPHLTIGRVNQHINSADQQKIRTALENCQVGILGHAQVQSVHLFRSDLRPSGAVYTPLFCAPLQGSNSRGDS